LINDQGALSVTNDAVAKPLPEKGMAIAWMMWLCAATFYCYQFVLRVSPGMLTQDLMREFAIQGCSLGIIGSFFYKAYAIMQIPLGIMMDRFGPRRILTFSCVLAATGSLLFALAPTFSFALIGRALVGAGAACGFIGTLKISTLWFPIEKLGRAIGLTMLLGTLGATFGGAPLGLMVENLGWRYAFTIVAVVGFSLAFTIYLIVRDRPAETNTKILPTNTKSVLSGLFQVITTKQIWLLAIFGCFMYVPLAVVADLWGTHFVVELYHIDCKIAASMITTIYIGVAVGSPLTVMLSDYTKNRKLAMYLAAIGSLIFYSIIIYVRDIPIEWMYVFMFLGGFAFTGQNLAFAAVAESMPLSSSGVAVGFLNMIVMLSGVIFEPLVGALLDWHWNGVMVGGVPAFTAENYRMALLPIPIVLILATVILIFIKETYPAAKRK
jgi:sugar phosphate permease